MNRKQLLLALTICCCNISAQDINTDFKSFRENVLAGYQGFRKGILDDYAKYLDGIWEDYSVFKGLKKSNAPKPTTIPQAEPENTPDNLVMPQVTPKAPDAPVKPQSTEPASPVLPVRPQEHKSMSFIFYGTPVSTSLMNVHPMKSIDNSSISNTWKKYREDKNSEVIQSLKDITQTLGLNEWLQVELVFAYADKCIGEHSSNDMVLLKHYLLASLGYDIRLAKAGNQLALLIPFVQTVYAKPFLEINGTRYYVFMDDDSSEIQSFLTCQIPSDVDKGRSVNLIFNKHELKLQKGTQKSFNLTDGSLNVSGTVDETIMKSLENYPQTDIPTYAQSKVLPSFQEHLLKQLRAQITGKSSIAAVASLLHFCQYAFLYETDGEQHGFEKPYFIEENFYYPKNDCEDRSILFAFLVRNLVGLDVHLIQFPGHECTAVHFDDESITGDSYMHEGKRYLICDPTYIGASIGQCMPNFIKDTPIVEFWRP